MSARVVALRQRILESMNTDAERWRFLVDHKLTLHTSGEHWMIHYYKTQEPGKPPKFYPVATGGSADEAIDNAIERWKLKHEVTERRSG